MTIMSEANAPAVEMLPFAKAAASSGRRSKMRDAGEAVALFGWRVEHCGTPRSCTGGAGFHITVFEPSYQEPSR
jgi:hypothetical protein